MTSVFLSPHNDDETLFGAYTLQRGRPHVIVVFCSVKQRSSGIMADEREMETAAAMGVLGCSWEQWRYRDNAGAGELEPLVHDRLESIRGMFDTCIAPAVEDGGHEQHNIVGQAALDVFGPDRVRQYLTYRRGFGKSAGVEIVPAPHEIVAKLRALACYESQIREPSCRPWFVGDLAEYIPA